MCDKHAKSTKSVNKQVTNASFYGRLYDCNALSKTRRAANGSRSTG